MIVVDLETSGLDPEKCGIWQIGAIELETGEEFLQESSIDKNDLVTKEALIIIGKTEKELRDKNKQSQKELLKKFFKWIEKRKDKIIISQNPQIVDYVFLLLRAKKYNLKFPVHYRTIDLHTLAQTIYYVKNKKFLVKDGNSDMGLGNIMKMCGLKDNRISVKEGKISRQGSPHNALEDAKLEATCFKKLLEEK